MLPLMLLMRGQWCAPWWQKACRRYGVTHGRRQSRAISGAGLATARSASPASIFLCQTWHPSPLGRVAETRISRNPSSLAQAVPRPWPGLPKIPWPEGARPRILRCLRAPVATEDARLRPRCPEEQGAISAPNEGGSKNEAGNIFQVRTAGENHTVKI